MYNKLITNIIIVAMIYDINYILIGIYKLICKISWHIVCDFIIVIYRHMNMYDIYYIINKC